MKDADIWDLFDFVTARCMEDVTPTPAAAEFAAVRRAGKQCLISDQALQGLARPYADHPDYRDEWRP